MMTKNMNTISPFRRDRVTVADVLRATRLALTDLISYEIACDLFSVMFVGFVALALLIVVAGADFDMTLAYLWNRLIDSLIVSLVIGIAWGSVLNWRREHWHFR